MRYQRDDAGHERIATIDIETTHYKPAEGETVSVGLYIHDRDEPADGATYEPFHRSGPDDEADMIVRALERLDDLDADLLVSYNGREFDMEFLQNRLYLCGHDEYSPSIDTTETHVDLLEDRKAVCERTGDKWPTLEECLDTYGFDEPTTIWGGQPVTNIRFGTELGPAYLEALQSSNGKRDDLERVIDHYLKTDLEANLAVYYSDIGAEFEPVHLGTQREF